MEHHGVERRSKTRSLRRSTATRNLLASAAAALKKSRKGYRRECCVCSTRAAPVCTEEHRIGRVVRQEAVQNRGCEAL